MAEGEPIAGPSTAGDTPVAKLVCLRTDFSLCIKCQLEKSEGLVTRPKDQSYETFLEHVNKRGDYGFDEYPLIQKRLEHMTAEQLKSAKATWHRTCYQETTLAKTTDAAYKQFQKGMTKQSVSPVIKRKSGRPSLETEKQTIPPGTTSSSEQSTRLLRSSGEKLEKTLCFFCNLDEYAVNLGKLHQVSNVTSTDDKHSVGKMIYDAVMGSDNEVWKVKIQQALDPHDLLAIDLNYHLPCYVRYVQRGPASKQAQYYEDPLKDVAATVEFFSLLNALLLTPDAQLPLDDLTEAYTEIREKHGVEKAKCSRRTIKRKIEEKMTGVEFARPKYGKCEVLIPSEGIDEATRHTQEARDADDDMKSICKIAELIRKQIMQQISVDGWAFDGDLHYEDRRDKVPTLLFSLIRWILLGTQTELKSEVREADTNTNVLNICQTIMYATKSSRQVQYQPKESERGFYQKESSENAFVVGVGLKTHCFTRSKSLVNYLHACGMSVNYTRLLRIETQIANAINDTITKFGVYIPPGLVKGQRIFFAADNIDWREDTSDGKKTLHATIIVVFQTEGDESGEKAAPPLTLSNSSDRSLKEIPSVMTETQPCYFRESFKPVKSLQYEDYSASKSSDEVDAAKMKDETWLVARTARRISEGKTSTEENTDLSKSQHVPTWAGFNSLIHEDSSPVTRICAMPLLLSPANEFSTLLTVLQQTGQVNAQVVGSDALTVLTLDMDLYQKALKLQCTMPELQGKYLLRIGEFHTVLCMIRTIGSFIEGSGIDDSWLEADIYGPVTIRQILEGKHLKRGITAHLITLQTMYAMYLNKFVETYPEFADVVTVIGEEICGESSGSSDDLKKTFERQQKNWNKMELQRKLQEFRESRMAFPMSKFSMMYMEMILVLMEFIRGSREGNWLLHLQSLEKFCSYFFMEDRLKYAQCVPEYIAKMYQLQHKDPDLWHWFNEGNFTVKKSSTAFCRLGVDQALEQVNKTLKVLGGVTGLTQKPGALAKFFLTAPELSRLAGETEKALLQGKTNKAMKHHEMSKPLIRRQEQAIQKLHEVFEKRNPFTSEGNNLVNIVTHTVLPEEFQKEILGSFDAGEQACAIFVKERVLGRKNLWDKMSRLKLKSWKSAGKVTKVKCGQETVELKEDRSLFARMAIVARSRPEIDIASDIGKYEFSCVSRSLFAPDGKLLPCQDKSKLIHLLEKTVPDIRITAPAASSTEDKSSDRINLDDQTGQTSTPQPSAKRAVIIDAMATLQELNTKPVKTCKEFAEEYLKAVEKKCTGYSEAHVIFDHYDVHKSLKSSTRDRRGNESTFSLCTDNTPIKQTFKKFISNTQTKQSMTEYLAEKLQEKYKDSPFPLVVSTSKGAESNILQVDHLSTSQEEADTIMIFHAQDIVRRGLEVDIVSPDTDVMVLAIAHLAKLGNDPTFITGTGSNHRHISLKPIQEAIGPEIADALLGFHAFTGCDNCGRFQGKGKTVAWKTLLGASADIKEAFSHLGMTATLSDSMMNILEEFVCLLFRPKSSKSTTLGELRWQLFRNSQAESQNLPPTQAALHQHILRASYQAQVWRKLDCAHPVLPSPTDCGWVEEEERYVPVITTLPPAPQAITELVRCGCVSSMCSSARCTCKRANLVCTELCKCGVDSDLCENHCDSSSILPECDTDSDEEY